MKHVDLVQQDPEMAGILHRQEFSTREYQHVRGRLVVCVCCVEGYLRYASFNSYVDPTVGPGM